MEPRQGARAALTRRTFLAGLGLGGLALAITACTPGAAPEADPSQSTDLVVGASHTPHALILNDPVRQILEEEGYHLQVVEYENYEEPNQALLDGEIDAAFYQHVPFLNAYNAEHGTALEAHAAVHFEPMGVYSETLTSIAEVPDGATVALPADTANRARALMLLEQERLIRLSDDAGTGATMESVAANPKGLTFKELPAEELPEALEEVDLAVVPGNVAMENGLSLPSALAAEPTRTLLSHTYANVLVTRPGEAEWPKIQALVAALNSKATHDYIEQAFGGNVIPVFEVVELPSPEEGQPEEPAPEG